MYHAHFGLERRLFGDGIASDAAVFRSSKHDRLIAHFKLALASANAAVMLRGPAGVGKTTITATALRASNTRLALAWVNSLPANAAELLELVLVELGVSTLRTSRIERLQLWRQYLAEARATDSRLFVIAERTEDLSPEALRALDQLTAPDAAGNPGANLVLLGNPGLDEHLASPLLESLRQRIRLKADLEPFTEAELQDYLRHQVACAGGHFDQLFAPGTVAALHRYSQGIVRLVNTLCESALDIAAVQRQKQLTAELVAKTAVSLLGLAEPVPAPRPTVPAARSDASARPVERRAAPRPAAADVAVELPMNPLADVQPAIAAAPVTPAVAASPVPPATPALQTPAVPAPVVVTPAPAPPSAAAAPVTASLTPPAPKPPPAAASSAPPAAAPRPAPLLEMEYDGSATDIGDIAITDFPVLTDAVDFPILTKAAKPSVAAAASVSAPAAAPTPQPPAAKPAAVKPMSRVETAYTASRPHISATIVAPPRVTPPPAVTSPTAAAPAAAPRVAAANPVKSEPRSAEADDLARQTQTMRAIAVAKSIDDISELDAETLFSDTELDLVSAAAASAAEWPDEDVESNPAPAESAAPPAPARRPFAPAPTPTAARPEPPPTTTQLPADDPFDLFGLGDDAPLELIDDSAPPSGDPTRKTAAR
jgi:type II secretory pathway predicted ATPase ExeA